MRNLHEKLVFEAKAAGCVRELSEHLNTDVIPISIPSLQYSTQFQGSHFSL